MFHNFKPAMLRHNAKTNLLWKDGRCSMEGCETKGCPGCDRLPDLARKQPKKYYAHLRQVLLDNSIYMWIPDPRICQWFKSFPCDPRSISGDAPKRQRPKLTLLPGPEADREALRIIGTHYAAKQRNATKQATQQDGKGSGWVAREAATSEADVNRKLATIQNGDNGEGNSYNPNAPPRRSRGRIQTRFIGTRKSKTKPGTYLTSGTGAVPKELTPAQRKAKTEAPGRRLLDRLHISETNGHAC